MLARMPAWAELCHPLPWLGALAWPAVAGLSGWVDRGGDGRLRGGAAALAVALALVWLASSDLGAAQWLGPAWHEHGVTAAIESWVVALADAAAPTLGVSGTSILVLEAVVAAAIAAPCVLALVHLVHASAAATRTAVPEIPPAAAWRIGALVVVVVAIALAWSRKTDGGVALIPAAIGVALACGSALQRAAARGPWPCFHASPLAIVAHLGWTALALWLVGCTAPDDGDPLRWLYTALAGVAALAPMLCCIGDPEPPEAGADARAPA
jgi:hypothetical protein